jgi:penicillin-binding protein 1C
VVTVRRALQLSLNVPAVAVLNKIGVSRLGSRLSQAGAALVLPKDAARWPWGSVAWASG